MDRIAHFGPGGFPPAFEESEYRFKRYGSRREGIFPWLKSLGLNWLELEYTYGVKMPIDQARSYRQVADENGIGLSIHAPYYCVLASDNRESVERSKRDLIAAFDISPILGVTRIIFHPGYPGSDGRKGSLDRIIEALLDIDRFRPTDVYVYPETGGKSNSIGSIEDIVYICKHVPFARPCLDLAHIHARELGSLTSADAIVERLNTVEREFGRQVLEEAHFHVYPVAVGRAGELNHRAFHDRIDDKISKELDPLIENDKRYYPLAEHFIEAVHRKNIVPTVICESRNSQERGAMLMKELYYSNS